MQERSNWRNAENDDDDSDDTGGYGSYKPERPAPARPERPERPPAPVHVPLSEGLIWRQNKDLWESLNPEGSKDKDDDEGEDDDEEEGSKQSVVAKKDKTDTDAGQEADNAVQEIPTEHTDGEDMTAKDEQQDSSASTYPEEITIPAAETTSPIVISEAQEYDQSTQPVAEALSTVSPDYYEQQATEPTAIPPELQVNQPPLPPISPLSERTDYVQPLERPADQPPYNPGLYSPQNVNEYAPVQSAANTAAERAPAPVDSHRHGEPLAVAVGLGLVAEHIGRKRGDRQQQKQIDRFAEETRQQQENIADNYQRTQEQQRALTAEQQRQVAEMRHMRMAQEHLAANPAAPYALENAPSTAQVSQRFESAAVNVPRPLGSVERQPGQQQGPEGQQQAPKTPEQPFEPTPEGMSVKPQQHVESSAWHNIVVDKHGHEVTDAIAYGQEFHRQREHEMLQDRVSGNPSAGGGGGAAGGGGIVGQQQDQPVLSSPFQYPQSTLPSGMTSPTLPPGHPSHVDPQHQLPATSKKEVTSNIANPWFWIMLALVIAAFFTAALI